MRITPLQAALACFTLFGLGAATGLSAQALTDSPQRVEAHRTELSGAPHMEVVVSTAEYRPGDVLPRHTHHGVEAAYIVQGAQVQAPGRPAMTLHTGASLLNLRDVPHAGFKVVGEGSLKLFTVHVVDKGAPLYDHSASNAP